MIVQDRRGVDSTIPHRIVKCGFGVESSRSFFCPDQQAGTSVLTHPHPLFGVCKRVGCHHLRVFLVKHVSCKTSNTQIMLFSFYQKECPFKKHDNCCKNGGEIVGEVKTTSIKSQRMKHPIAKGRDCGFKAASGQSRV